MVLGGTTHLKGGEMDRVERRLPAIRSGFLKRPAILAGQPARSSKHSRKRFRSSIPFVRAYASLVCAVHMPNGKEEFPDNYCLEASGTKNWYFLTREPSLRAARRMVAIALDNPGRIASPLPYTVRELSYRSPMAFDMIINLSKQGDRSSFPKRNIACCNARIVYNPSILEGKGWETNKIRFGDLSSETRLDPYVYGRECYSRCTRHLLEAFNAPSHRPPKVATRDNL